LPAWFRYCVNWQALISPGSAYAYLVAAVLVFVAALVRWGLGFIGGEILTFETFFPAVLLATVVGGGGAGIFAAVLGGIIGYWAFTPPYFMFFPVTSESVISSFSYLLASLLVVWAGEHYRRLTKRLRDEETFRKLAIEELGHRLKNKTASIQSIIGYQLRDHRLLRDDIANRLAALSGTDDLIMAAQGHGANIRDILSTELKPHELSRVSLDGPDVLLSEKLALTMALLAHELATNAAKYGALSNPVGKLAICWSLSGRTLKFEWRECGGPIVTAPTHHGFGLRLLSRALDQFSGTVETKFEQTGLVCKMKALLPEST
jgi:two-component sensor histidine kinase